MKSIIQIAVLLFIFTDVSTGQDNFKVIKVNGTILLKQKGVSLETGTVFSVNDDLIFRSEDATAAVINPQKGRLIITNRSHDLSNARSNFLPAMYNIASRGGGLSNIIDLKNHFSGKYVVLDNQDIVLDTTNFPMDKNHFFYLRYAYRGEDINKKLQYSADTLKISRESLFTVDGNPIPSPDNTLISLFYRNGSESVLVNRFDLIFPDPEQLRKEVQIILEELKNKKATEKTEEVNAYINEFYGKVYRLNLITWLDTNFGLKK